MMVNFCPKCGVKIDNRNAKFCMECGHSFAAYIGIELPKTSEESMNDDNGRKYKIL